MLDAPATDDEVRPPVLLPPPSPEVSAVEVAVLVLPPGVAVWVPLLPPVSDVPPAPRGLVVVELEQAAVKASPMSEVERRTLLMDMIPLAERMKLTLRV